MDRLTTRTNPNSSTVTTDYKGLTEIATNELGQDRTTLSNGLGQLISSTDALQTAVNYRYAPFNNLESTKIDGIETFISYDVLGRKVSINDPDMGLQIFHYNALNHAYRHINALGQQTKTTYDKLGRAIGRIDDATASSPATRTHSWIFDTALNGMGQLGSVIGYDTDGRAFSESYEYNSDGLLTTTTTNITGQPSSFVVTHYYDAFNRDDGIVYPTGFALEHSYNSHGFLDKVHPPGNPSSPYWQANTVDAQGNLTQFQQGNGIVTDQAFIDETNRIDTIEAHKNGWYAQRHDYDFDALGNLKQRIDYRTSTAITQNFCYDDLNRLKASRFNSGCSSSDNDFTYDALGNITYKIGVGNYSYGAGSAGPHAVTSAGGISYVYNSNGNMTSGGGRTVTYTPFGKPNHMSKTSRSVHIAYGPDKNRIQRVDNSNKTTTYVGALYEKVEQGSDITHTHYLGDFALYVEEAGSSSNERFVYLHRDHIGSIAAKTDENAQNDTHMELMANGPWGVRKDETWDGSDLGEGYVANDTARGFTDHEHLDGVGLTHMNGRVYDPSLGRFLSPDPYINDPDNSQSFNRYSYVLNNPLSYTDPTGYIEEVLVTAPRIATSFSSFGLGSFSFGAIGSSIASALPGLSLMAFSPAVGGCDGNGMCADMLYPVDENGLIVLNEPTDGSGEQTETEKQDEAKAENKEKRTEQISVAASPPPSNGDGPENNNGDDKPKTREELHKDLTDKGFELKGTSPNGYTTYKGPNGTTVTVKPSGEVIRTQKIWKADGSGKFPQRQTCSGKPIANQSHSTGHFVEPL